MNNLSLDDFARLDKKRYDYETWMMAEFNRLRLKGKRVLEIGYGMGSDHLQLAKRGADLYGIDLTEQNLPICRQHLEMYGFSSHLVVGDAENLPYEDNFFDVVYTFGVIHHTPDMEKVVEEIYRVLKPGGMVWCGVYNKNSWFYRCKILTDYICSGDFCRMKLRERLSLIEHPGNDKNIYIRLTTKRELRSIFRKFHIKEMKNRSIDKEYFKVKGKDILSDWAIGYLGEKFGWYNIVVAQK